MSNYLNGMYVLHWSELKDGMKLYELLTRWRQYIGKMEKRITKLETLCFHLEKDLKDVKVLKEKDQRRVEELRGY